MEAEWQHLTGAHFRVASCLLQRLAARGGRRCMTKEPKSPSSQQEMQRRVLSEGFIDAAVDRFMHHLCCAGCITLHMAAQHNISHTVGRPWPKSGGKASLHLDMSLSRTPDFPSCSQLPCTSTQRHHNRGHEDDIRACTT